MTRGSYGTPLVPAAARVPRVEGLEPRIATWSIYGRPHRARINPLDYDIPHFAATIADTWLDVMGELRAAESVTPPVRYFLTHVNNQPREVSDGRDFTIADLRRRHLDAWEVDLLARHQRARTDTAYRDAVYVFALLRRIEADNPGTLHSDVLLRLESQTRLHHVRRPGLPPFTPAEIRRMRSHAHRLVHRAHRSSDEPSVEVLVALHVLLRLPCGEPPEVLRGLRLSDIEATAAPGHNTTHNTAHDAGHDTACESMTRAQRLTYLATHDLVETYAVTYTKNRAHETYQQIYTRRDHAAHRGFTRALALTGRLRADRALDRLWVQRRAGGEVAEAGWRSKPFALKDWLRRGGIDIAGSPHFIRFRKAVTAAEALANPARYLRDTRRHGAGTFFGHYASSPVLRAEAGRLFITTIGDYFDAAVHGPTVITAEAETLLAEHTSTDLLDDHTAQALLNGDLDGPHTACRDPRNSPHTPAGQTCDRSTTGTCFGCPNALITRHHLPAALLIAELADPNRAADPAAWLRHWKPIYDSIVHVVLPAFSAGDIAAARTQVDRVPLALGTRNDMRGVDGDAS